MTTPPRDLQGAWAVVTGGSRGIGRAISRELAQYGSDVLILFREEEQAARATVAELCELGVRAEARRADVRDPEAVGVAIDSLAGAGESIGILVNCAGITADRTVGKLRMADWRAVIDTNLTGCFTTVQAVLPHMRSVGYGRIVNVGSIIGQTGNWGQANYAAAKAGVLGFTKSLARETAQQDITVNAVCPGFIDTDMLATVSPEIIETIRRRIPKGRLGQPEDVAYAVAFLAAPRAAYITGQTINVNGGDYM
jgi:NAD(P)-dependent dehydrogenase (short-subunit alcohol dehydrogenase family)